MKNPKKRIFTFILRILTAGLLFAFCVACKSAESSSDFKTEGPEDDIVTVETGIPIEMTPEPDSQISVLDTMVANGEITEYWNGERLNVVYKYVPSTFDSAEKFLVGVVDNNGNFVTELSEDKDEIFVKFQAYGDGGKVCEIHHLGNDIFSTSVIGYVDYGMYDGCEVNIYNATTNTALILGATNGYFEYGALDVYFSDDAYNNIIEGFHNGVIVTTERLRDGICIQLIFDNGTVERTPIYIEGNYSSYYEQYYIVGKYSEGVFFYNQKFYDLDGECIIDCSEYPMQYSYDDVPMFENGKCHLKIYKNSKLWDVYIDTLGNIIGDPTEHIG